MHPHLSVQAVLKPSRFVRDSNPAKFNEVVEELRARRYQKAVIMGNGPSFNLIDDADVAAYHRGGYLSIGLNRSIYRFVTRVLIWSDVETLRAILSPESKIDTDDANDPMIVVKAVLPVRRAFKRQIRRWERNRSFDAFPSNKLFMFRTVLTAALHLCWLLRIRKVLLVGVDLDSRSYFFKNSMFDPKQPYELRNHRSIKGHFQNYSTHRIVKEVLESMIEQGFDVRYLGESQFLKTINGLRRETTSLPF